MAPKRTPSVEIKLAATDWIQFDLACRLNGKSRTEMARYAIQSYLENQNNPAVEAKESALEQRLKKIEDRLAGIMAKSAFENNKRLDALTNRLAKLNARTALDTGCTFMLIFRLLNKETREQVVKWAATSAYERLEQKLKYPETNMQELMHWLEEDPGNAPNGRKA
ncbi:MAG TPA: hypothetical protein V6C97_01165 [Oculatellaceae cyanobacterium]